MNSVSWFRVPGLVLLFLLAAAGPAPKRGTIEKLAREYDAPLSAIREMREVGMGWGEIGHAVVIAKKSRKSLAEVVAARRSGLGWGEVARESGFSLSEVRAPAREFSRRAAAHEQRAGVWPTVAPADPGQGPQLSREFSVDTRVVEGLRENGYSYPEVRTVLTLARDSGKTPSEIAKLHDSGQSWDSIARKLRVDLRGVQRGPRP